MTTATFHIYEPIVEDSYLGGISPTLFLEFLNGLDESVKQIDIRLNSPGGSVFAARVIEQHIRESKIPVNTYIDGLCASAATYVGLAGKTVHIGKGAFLMMHLAQSIAAGNTHDLIIKAVLLAKIDESIVATYHEKTGIAQQELIKMMEVETWLNAEEAVAMGFADIINETEPDKQPVMNWTNTVINFEKAPEAFKQLVENAAKPTGAAGTFEEIKPTHSVVRPENKKHDVAALLRKIEIRQRTF